MTDPYMQHTKETITLCFNQLQMVEIEGLHEINHGKLCYYLIANQQQLS
jgi:hypothetical protein